MLNYYDDLFQDYFEDSEVLDYEDKFIQEKFPDSTERSIVISAPLYMHAGRPTRSSNHSVHRRRKSGF